MRLKRELLDETRVFDHNVKFNLISNKIEV